MPMQPDPYRTPEDPMMSMLGAMKNVFGKAPFGVGVKAKYPTRPSSGMAGDAEMQASARFYQQMLNEQMGTEIGNINTQWGPTRYGSGQRTGAIERAQERYSGMYGDYLSRTSLQRYLAERGWQEERDWRQAQLDMSGGGMTEGLFGIGSNLSSLYLLGLL